tara:strand:- start:3082 stop:4407 length:1326 start_codon:yes stop_codon:yes gene_type:complete
MANEFQGLFQGAGVGDVRQAMEQERVGRIRQAMANTGNLGTQYTPNYAAAIAGGRQEMSEAIGGLGRAVGNEMGMEIPDDPRIQKAQQREKDKGEIMGILGGFSDPKSPGGKKITEKEMEIGFSELMKRGYTKEAQEFLSMSQSMRKMDIDALKASTAGNSLALRQKVFDLDNDRNVKSTTEIGDFEDTSGRKFKKIALVMKDGTTSTKTIPWDGNESIAPSGALVGIDSKGQTSTARLSEEEKKKQKESDITIDQGKKLKWTDSRQAMIDLGENAKREFGDLTRAVALSAKVKTGGAREIMLNVRQFLGVDSGDAGELASLFRTGVISRLKEMGSKPTDRDLTYLESAVQSLGNDNETNSRILVRMVARVKQIISRGEYLKKNKGVNTQEKFNDNSYKARTYQWEGRGGDGEAPNPTEVQDEWNDAIGAGAPIGAGVPST